MKKIFTIAAATLIAATSFSQTSKGTWLLGGSAGFNSSKSGSADAVSTIHISPNAGYFVANNVAVGANIAFESESKDHTAFNFGPMVRYYFTDLGKTAKLFAHANVGFGSYKPEGGNSVSSTNWGIAAGPAFFLNKSIALEATIGYSSLKIKDVADATTNFGVNFGFQIHLGK